MCISFLHKIESPYCGGEATRCAVSKTHVSFHMLQVSFHVYVGLFCVLYISFFHKIEPPYLRRRYLVRSIRNAGFFSNVYRSLFICI